MSEQNKASTKERIMKVAAKMFSEKGGDYSETIF